MSMHRTFIYKIPESPWKWWSIYHGCRVKYGWMYVGGDKKTEMNGKFRAAILKNTKIYKMLLGMH